MSVVFKAFDQIEIDGIPAGNIVDVISNHASKRLQVLEAYKAFTENLTSQVSSLEAVVEEQKQKIVELEQYRPYNPRILAGKAFYNRVSKEDMVTLLTSEIPQLVVVGKEIVAYAENDWPVILDSTDFRDLVGYVLQSGVFDEAEVTEIMRDATREEAYRVPE